jgi:hypothetical protein
MRGRPDLLGEHSEFVLELIEFFQFGGGGKSAYPEYGPPPGAMLPNSIHFCASQQNRAPISQKKSNIDQAAEPRTH